MKEVLGWVTGIVAGMTMLYFGMLTAGVQGNLAITCFIGGVVFLVLTESLFVSNSWLARVFHQPIVSAYKSAIVTVGICVGLFVSFVFFNNIQLHEVFLAFSGLFFFGCPVWVFMTAPYYEVRVRSVLLGHLVGGVGIYGVVALRTWWPGALAAVVLSAWWLVLDRKEKRVVAA